MGVHVCALLRARVLVCAQEYAPAQMCAFVLVCAWMCACVCVHMHECALGGGLGRTLGFYTCEGEKEAGQAEREVNPQGSETARGSMVLLSFNLSLDMGKATTFSQK